MKNKNHKKKDHRAGRQPGDYKRDSVSSNSRVNHGNSGNRENREVKENKDFNIKRERRSFGENNKDNQDNRDAFQRRPDRRQERRSVDYLKEREQEQDFIENRLEGRNPVLEALRSGRTVDKMLVARGMGEGSIREIIRRAREKGVVVQEVERQRLDEISGSGVHQGVIAYVTPYQYIEVDEMLSRAKAKGEPPFLIILDEITDPHNLGAIIRTAECSGAHGIIIPKRRSVGLTPAVIKASAGAVEYLPVAKVTNLTRLLEDLKSQGIWIAGADLGGSSYTSQDFTGSIALVVGSEGHGISRLVKEKCDYLVKIPLKGNIESLNASVAAGVLMYEVVRQRG